MTEDDAQAWVRDRFGSTMHGRISRFVAMLESENDRQNLIARSTLPQLWSRHIVDSLQLLDHDAEGGRWVDVGTGGGFPGLVVGLVRCGETILVEPRRRRAEFLSEVTTMLGMAGQIVVRASKVETLRGAADVISARAVASMEKLFQIASHLSTQSTRWLLPRGRIDPDEVATMRKDWSFMFHVEQNLVDPSSAIAIVEGLKRR